MRAPSELILLLLPACGLCCCLQVINPKPAGPCVSSLAIDITPSPRKAAKGSLITWAVTLTPRNGSVVDVNVTNPIPSTLSTPTVIRQPVGGRCSFVQSSGQQMLQCAFANISTAVTVQYTTRANVAGAISNTAEAKYKACKNTQVVITIRNNNNVVIWVSGCCCLETCSRLSHQPADPAVLRLVNMLIIIPAVTCVFTSLGLLHCTACSRAAHGTGNITKLQLFFALHCLAYIVLFC
jgi:hypothetical protein